MLYAGLLFLIAGGFVYMESDPAKVVISLLFVVQFIVPLISIVLGTIHYYNSREFIELTLTQPIRRRSLFLAQYLGLSGVLSAALVVGMGLPLLANGYQPASLYLIINAVILTFIFVGLAFLVSTLCNDKAKGVGVSLGIWFYFTILYDVLVLAALFYFQDYPLEKPVLAFTALNPIDLSRIIILMNLDASALMGYTGALYQAFFGSIGGILIAFACMLVWAAVPALIAMRRFIRKDF
jgi:Cu-processing system permease protein